MAITMATVADSFEWEKVVRRVLQERGEPIQCVSRVGMAAVTARNANASLTQPSQ